MRAVCPDCKRSARFYYRKREKKYYCEYCGKYYDKPEYKNDNK
jgi:ribosomal protein L37AE/L43A